MCKFKAHGTAFLTAGFKRPRLKQSCFLLSCFTTLLHTEFVTCAARCVRDIREGAERNNPSLKSEMLQELQEKDTSAEPEARLPPPEDSPRSGLSVNLNHEKHHT